MLFCLAITDHKYDCVCNFDTCVKVYTLFHKIIADENHCLSQLLPARRNTLNLRPRGHEFVLPSAKGTAYSKSFMMRCLYNYV